MFLFKSYPELSALDFLFNFCLIASSVRMCQAIIPLSKVQLSDKPPTGPSANTILHYSV